MWASRFFSSALLLPTAIRNPIPSHTDRFVHYAVLQDLHLFRRSLLWALYRNFQGSTQLTLIVSYSRHPRGIIADPQPGARTRRCH